VSITPRPTLPSGLDTANIFRDKFGHLGDEEWFDVLVQAMDTETIDDVRFPQYPAAELQNRIHGYANEHALREALNFYQFIKSHEDISRKLTAEASFLDFAAGWGRMSRPFLRHFDLCNIYGYEPNLAFCVIARTLNPYICFINGGYAPDNALPRNRFDLVIGYSIFSHLSESAAALWLSEMARVTRPDAYCVFTTWGERFLSRLIRERDELARGGEIHWYSRECLTAAGDVEELLDRYRSGETIWFSSNPAGAYGEAFFHPKALIKLLETHRIPLELVEFDQAHLAQDAFILHRIKTKAATTTAIELPLPTSADQLALDAWDAMGRGDGNEAARLWEAMRISAPDRADGYIGGSHVLRGLGRMAEAETVSAEAVTRFPESPDVLTAHAWVAMGMEDWDEALRRWQLARERFPEHADAYIWPTHALRRANRLSEAEMLSSNALQRFPDNPDALVEHAWVAMDRWDWGEAVRRWEIVRWHAPDRLEGYIWPVRALRALGRLDEADAMATKALARFSDNAVVLAEQILIAVYRGDWEQAARYLEASRDQLTIDGHLDPELRWIDYRVRLRTLPSANESEPANDMPETGLGLPLGELMPQFESFGPRQDLGVIQRHYGAEPTGLLCFAKAPYEALVSALNSRFSGFADDDDIAFTLYSGEYIATSRRYQLAFRTGVYDKDASSVDERGQFFAQQRRRLVFLTDKLVADLEAGQKIFVYANYERLSGEETERLFEAVRQYGANSLLCVGPAETGHPDGTVEMVQDGLFAAYLGFFADFDFGEEPVYGSWRRICETTYRLARRRGAVGNAARRTAASGRRRK
jgi:tetratricopeptide (TPR) repeat protein